MYVAYKKGLIKIQDPQLLDALLYAMKFKGAAISGDEIKEILRIGWTINSAQFIRSETIINKKTDSLN